MIQFPCTCGHVFSVSDDEAGGYAQCPQCARLNDVPSHSDLHNLAEDGTFKLSEPPVPPKEDPERVDELAYVFRKSRTDDEGEDIDLRNTHDDLATLDAQPTALDPGAAPRRHAPQYDPETGELVRPLDVKPDPVHDLDPRSIPIATQAGADGTPVIDYARVASAVEPPAHRVSLTRIPAELFRPVNLVVMAFIFFFHVVFNMLLLTMMTGFFIIAAGTLAVGALLIAHYGNVIDEIGREEADELPRVLRQMNWLDDLWHPFIQVAGSLLICFLPAIVTASWGAAHSAIPALIWGPVALALAAAGAVMFPAVLLTVVTSGSVMNLRPDRVAGVIRVAWRTYPVTALVFMGCALAYGFGFFGSLYSLLVWMGLFDMADIGAIGRGLIAYPLLIVGIYLAHLFCWRLGLTYRAHQAAFPWILQRFQAERREAVPLTEADRAAMRKTREARAAAARGQLPRHAG